jgi:hypothetical protein
MEGSLMSVSPSALNTADEFGLFVKLLERYRLPITALRTHPEFGVVFAPELLEEITEALPMQWREAFYAQAERWHEAGGDDLWEEAGHRPAGNA